MKKNNRNLIIEQTLHGYSQGHHLLASSKRLSDGSLRIMSTLSDLSGPEVYKGFSEYITGYPLKDDKCYALGKTWYASEMKRPGCVWTHSLLLSFDDLERFNNYSKLLELFIRPEKDFDFDKEIYSQSIELPSDFENDHFELHKSLANISLEVLKYLLWSIHNNSQPVILPVVNPGQYLREVLILWQNQNLNLRRKFTFCTGSLANRKIGKETFDFQIVPHVLTKSIGRSERQIKVLDNLNTTLLNYPKWVINISEELLVIDGRLKFKDFVRHFGIDSERKELFGKIARLYTEANIGTSGIKINTYLEVGKSMFESDDYDILVSKLIYRVLSFSPDNRWFMFDELPKLILELSTTSNIKNSCKQLQVRTRLESLWSKDKNIIRRLFHKLISQRKLNKFGENLIKEFSLLVEQKELPKFTNMDLGACNVLVTLNPEFALCPQIWQQSRNFQCELIDCIDARSISEELIAEIIELIIENSRESISEKVYNTFGSVSTRIFLDWCLSTGKQKDNWMQLCNNSPEECINWLLAVKSLDDVSLFVSIASRLDPYSKAISQYGIKPWLRIFDKLDFKKINEDSRFLLAQFFLPIMLMSKDDVTKEFAEFVFYPIDAKLANQQFDYDQWQKLDKLLPRLSWYNSWDKSKRLRKAMKRKGYQF
ncbi:hypothetical protein MFMK1_001158 [Metallumcola ferriviriculae]|uniref:Uncharacterized protein n=1 Tax=Metallumcola ferriviriculae TaxID=3039180 RepID=A0AAU0UMD0_9FIRM|nr:hypothetical protein MFMK1_001158 [Desulfitibacteraceae bacterium MK1]